MKKLFNKYFNLIGVHNEGYKRLIFIGLIIGWVWSYQLGSGELVSLVDDFPDTHLMTLQIISLPIIVFGIVIGTFNWIRKGFNEDK